MNIPHRLGRVGRFFAVVGLAVAPAVLALFLVGHYFGANLMDFSPAYDVDQYFYTREAATFAAAGFDGGYFGGNGHVARLGRFGPHGPAYAMVYGGLAKLLGGWRDGLAPALNFACLSLALLACARRLPLAAFAGLALVLAFFPPAVLYLPTAYQDAPQYAVALVLALALARLLSPSRASRRDLVLALILTLAAALTRPTWAVLFPAICFAATPGRSRDALWSLPLGGLALAAAYGLFSLTTPTWVVDVGPGYVAALLRGDPGPLLHVLGENCRRLFDFTDNRDPALALLLMLLGTGLALAFGPPGRIVRRKLAVLHVCNILAPLLVYVAVYTGSGRHLTRLLSAHFVLTLALAVKTARFPSLVLAPVLAACLALFPATLNQYVLFVRPAYDDFMEFTPRIEAFRQAADPALSLSLAAKNPWLRTLAVCGVDQDVAYLGAPPAYGIQIYTQKGLDAPMRAGFAVLSPLAAALAGRHTPLTPVAETPIGTLYRNDAAFGFATPQEARP